MLRNYGIVDIVRPYVTLLNEVLSLNAQESLND